MQIIASTGSGKTEVVSQRVTDLLAEGVRPDAIVAFTFTERAAAELKARNPAAHNPNQLKPPNFGTLLEGQVSQFLGTYVGDAEVLGSAHQIGDEAFGRRSCRRCACAFSVVGSG